MLWRHFADAVAVGSQLRAAAQLNMPILCGFPLQFAGCTGKGIGLLLSSHACTATTECVVISVATTNVLSSLLPPVLYTCVLNPTHFGHVAAATLPCQPSPRQCMVSGDNVGKQMGAASPLSCALLGLATGHGMPAAQPLPASVFLRRRDLHNRSRDCGGHAVRLLQRVLVGGVHPACVAAP